ncbi:MAG: right-handed parallel beta-helix repeat-containing protein [Nanoarchaeota archaeon]|nr:right-handed parallel beta-helix repeat-containing protein [Nanoarchaeota archaeon]
MLKKGLFLFIFLICIIGVNSYNYSACNQTISSGNHLLNQSISGFAGDRCFNFIADNVVFDCQGFSINGDNDPSTNYSFLAHTRSNITIRNCNINGGFLNGVYLYQSNNSFVENINIYSSRGNGFNIYNSSNNYINNITINDSGDDGLYLSFYSNNNSLSNIISYSNFDRGLEIYLVSGNKLVNLSFYNNNMSGIYMRFSTDNIFNNFSSYNNNIYGLYSENPLGNNTFYNFNLHDNNYGLVMLESSNNSFKNFLTWNNTLDGINFNNANNISLENFSSYFNFDEGIQIFNSTNLILNDFSLFNNSGSGLLVFSNSNFNNFSNFDVFNSIEVGILIHGSSRNNFLNFTTYENGNDGLSITVNSDNNMFDDFSSYNNFDDGIQVYNLSDNNSLSNFKTFNNTDEGIFISIGANNNIFFNSNSSSNSGFNLNLYYSGLAYSLGNIFYNNSFGSSSQFVSNYDLSTNRNFFNSSLSGFNLGNLWDNFNSCLLTEMRGGENVCISPSNFTINITNNVFDLAPLYPNAVTPSLNLTYITFDNTSLFRNWTYLEVLASSNISSCNLYWNGTIDNSTSIIGGNTCSINKTGNFGNSYNFYIEANSSLGVVNQSSNLSVSFYAPIQFSNHNLSFLNNNSVQINWSTNELLNSTIYYWKNLTSNYSLSNSTSLINHTFNLLNLANLTTYFYSLNNCYSDPNNMCNNYGPFNFTTLGGNGSMNGSGNSSMNITTLSSCQTINESGYYNLSADINNLNGTCLNIIIDNINLDCGDFTILGNISQIDKSGIYINNSNNITINNCNINSSYYTISGFNINVLNLNNLKLNNGISSGLHLINNTNSNIENITIDNFLSGIFLANSSNINFNYVNISGIISNSFILEDSDNILINNSQTTGGSYGVYFTYASFGPYTNNRVLNSKFLDLDYYGLRVDPNFDEGIYKNLIIEGNDATITYGIRNYGDGGLFDNITFNRDFQYGFYFYGAASNNTLRNSIFNLSNFDYDIYFNEGLGTFYNNSIYNNRLNNNSKIHFTDSFSTVNFNFTYLGENIGNYWKGLNCISSELRGNFTVCNNPSQYTINGGISIYDYAPMPASILSATIITPLNGSTINVSSKSINFQSTYSKNLNALGYWASGTYFNLSEYISGMSFNRNISLLNYGYQEIIFTFEDIDDYILNKSIFLNVSLNFIGANSNDIDGDGINNSLDKLKGFSENINANFPLVVEINGSNNLFKIFSSTLELNFKDSQNNSVLKFDNDFSSNSIDLSNITLIKRNIENSSGVLVNGVRLDGSNLKTFSLNLSGDISKYSSLCIKDEEVISFDEISSSCSGSNEHYIHNIPYSSGNYNIVFYPNSTRFVEIIGMSNSAAIQVCTENWIYGDWGTCSGGSQSRTSSDLNLCGTTFTRGALTQSCTDPGGGGGGGGGGGDDDDDNDNNNDDDNDDNNDEEIIDDDDLELNETINNNSSLNLTNQSLNDSNQNFDTGTFIGDISKIEIYKSILLNTDYSFKFGNYEYNGYFTLTTYSGIVYVPNNGRGIDLKNNYGKIDVDSDGKSDFEIVISEASGNYILNAKILEEDEIIDVVEDNQDILYDDDEEEEDDFYEDSDTNLNGENSDLGNNNLLWIIVGVVLFILVTGGFGAIIYIKKKKNSLSSNNGSLDISTNNNYTGKEDSNSYYGSTPSSLNNIRSSHYVPDNVDGTVDTRDHKELISTPDPSPLVISNLAKCKNLQDVSNLVTSFETNLNKLIKSENEVVKELKKERNRLIEKGYSRTDIYAYLKENNVLNYLVSRILSFDELTENLEKFTKQEGFENMSGKEIKEKLLKEDWFAQSYNYSGDGEEILNDILFMLAGTKIYGFIKDRFNKVFEEEMKYGIENNLRSGNVPKEMNLDKLLKLEDNIYYYEKLIVELEKNLKRMGMPKEERDKIEGKVQVLKAKIKNYTKSNNL